ncbi:hypothetical protein GOODEAATRI_033147, partial [Goodea atripinnis]
YLICGLPGLSKTYGDTYQIVPTGRGRRLRPPPGHSGSFLILSPVLEPDPETQRKEQMEGRASVANHQSPNCQKADGYAYEVHQPAVAAFRWPEMCAPEHRVQNSQRVSPEPQGVLPESAYRVQSRAGAAAPARPDAEHEPALRVYDQAPSAHQPCPALTGSEERTPYRRDRASNR